MLNIIKGRRSTRAFKRISIEDEKLNTVIEAGRYAPSGGNSQSTHFLVIKNAEILTSLGTIVREEFSKMEVTDGMYRSMAHSIRASKAGAYNFYYNAPVLIITANQSNYSNNIADCSCALENMMIMANALDLGSCWINQLKWLNENPEIIKFGLQFGLEKSERIYGSLALGYADTPTGLPNRTPLERTGNIVSFVE